MRWRDDWRRNVEATPSEPSAMSSVSTRFRAWLGSVEFAVTATAIVVALAVGVLVFESVAESNDAIFAVLLAGVAVPNIFDEQWGIELGNRLVGVAWGALASLAIIACYLAVVTGFRDVLDGSVASIGAFVVAWFLGIFVARAATRASSS